MGDDLVNDGILPVGGTIVDDEDPNEVESDDFLDDPVEIVQEEVPDVPAAAAITDDEDDDPIEEDE